MYLNTLKPGAGSRKKHVRVGRGVGSGLGKTCGRGIKGSGARKSPNVRPGFEGGQMPMKIRLPKFGFWSPKKQFAAEVPLNSLNKIEGDVVNMETLLAAGLITKKAKYVKIILSKVPNFTRKVEVKGVGVTRGAKAAIEAQGGTVEVAQWVLDAAKRREVSQTKSRVKRQGLIDKLNATGIQKPAKRDKAAKAEAKAGGRKTAKK